VNWKRWAARLLGWGTTLPYRARGRRVQLGAGLLANGRLRISGPGTVILGPSVNAWSHAELNRIITTTREAVIRIGPGSRLNGCTLIAAKRIEVGAECVLGSCLIQDHEPPAPHGRSPDFATRGPVVLDDCVWVGGQAVVMPGLRIGRGSVVGLHAVVFDSVPAGVVVAGNPARLVRRLDDQRS